MSNQSLLITGGTGTFGKTFVNYCLENDLYSRIVIFSRDEYKQHQLSKQLLSSMNREDYDSKIRFFLGDVRDYRRLKRAMRGIDVVVHAAALKHVPFCEYNPDEAIKTNVNGTKNVCDAAIESNVKKVVVLSTDKAVEPINFYGSTKMLAEKYAVYSNNYSKRLNDSTTEKLTKISCVRYGNIVGSRGSIVEIFKSMKQNDCFTITDADMTRFWMDITDSVKMVQWSIEKCLGGEIIIPKLKSSKIVDIAKIIDPKKDIKIIGTRPGEKIHEQLFNRREHENAFDVGDYYAVLPENNDWNSKLETHYRDFTHVDRKSYASNDLDLIIKHQDLVHLVEKEV
jgi:FlaA1/EpsC-like NDP-sugar epimerase